MDYPRLNPELIYINFCGYNKDPFGICIGQIKFQKLYKR